MLVRPSFAKSQFVNIDLFARHCGNILEALQATTAAVDRQELFKRLFMDIITKMLLRSSTNSLKGKDGDGLDAVSDACKRVYPESRLAEDRARTEGRTFGQTAKTVNHDTFCTALSITMWSIFCK